MVLSDVEERVGAGGTRRLFSQPLPRQLSWVVPSGLVPIGGNGGLNDATVGDMSAAPCAAAASADVDTMVTNGDADDAAVE